LLERFPGAAPLFGLAAMLGTPERPIERIRETCEMMGVAEKFDRALPGLETYV
jgi:hypothetical protein